jgi:predicted HTH transcriptional regulator
MLDKKFDNVMIKCARFKGTTMENFIDKKEFVGNLFYILDQSIFGCPLGTILTFAIVSLSR